MADTSGAVGHQERTPAAQLYERGVSLNAVENALPLAAARRLIRAAGTAPPGTVRPELTLLAQADTQVPSPETRTLDSPDLAPAVHGLLATLLRVARRSLDVWCRID
jgi:hypothetical protein